MGDPHPTSHRPEFPTLPCSPAGRFYVAVLISRWFKLVAITASGLEHEKAGDLKSGFHSFLAKPFREEEVLMRVATHVKIRTLTSALERRSEELVSRSVELQSEVQRRRLAEPAANEANDARSLFLAQSPEAPGLRTHVGSGRCQREDETWGHPAGDLVRSQPVEAPGCGRRNGDHAPPLRRHHGQRTVHPIRSRADRGAFLQGRGAHAAPGKHHVTRG